MWQVIEGDKVLKSYPYREQCVTWCYLGGYMLSGGRRITLQHGLRIVEVKFK